MLVISCRASRTQCARWALGLCLGSAIAALARRRSALSSSGAVGAAAVGTIVFGAGGVRGSVPLLLFFGSSTSLSWLSRSTTEHTGPRRTLAQVLANGGVPSALLLYNLWRPSPRVMHAYVGALVAANSDTWATEIGRHSRARPRLITTGRVAEPGVSGAITPLGTAASIAGAALISASWARFTHGGLTTAIGLSCAGIAGSLADSVLGATLQSVYVCSMCGKRTENRHHIHGETESSLILIHGLAFMTNDTVNLCASLVGALVGAAD